MTIFASLFGAYFECWSFAVFFSVSFLIDLPKSLVKTEQSSFCRDQRHFIDLTLRHLALTEVEIFNCLYWV